MTEAKGCAITTSKPASLTGGGCVELVAATLSAACPVADGTSLDLGFKIRAKTPATGLLWRRSADSFDAVFPGSGAVGSDGTTSVSLTDVALADRVAFEVTEGGRVVLRFVIRHR